MKTTKISNTSGRRIAAIHTSRPAYHTLCTGVLCLMLLFAGCSPDDAPSEKGESPDIPTLRRVAETRDYRDRITGLYTYDTQGCLQKIEARDHYSIPGSVRSYTMEFAYDNGRVSTMTLHYLSADYEKAFDHQITYHYDAQERLTGETTHMLNSPATSSVYYEYDESGRIVQWKSHRTDEPALNAAYDEQGNVERVWWIVPNPGYLGTPKTQSEIAERHYTYDTHPIPSFGIDCLPFVEPLPYFGTAATAEKNLSACNMTRCRHSSWLYTYDEAGYPATIESRFDGVETEEPTIVKLKYIEIK